ncbi:hypothetical protein VTJ49DRAFT_396 [Mycothermus thermophilus]|uniref:Pleckstrin homology domain-containing protein n=1 Tax=Humicola insolens TaxID=85995 RepID=A0ABR3VPD5_HUMIN
MARRPSDAFSQYSAASEAPSGRPRRMSMEEDMFYREHLTARPAKPPSYESAMKAAMAAQRRAMQGGGAPQVPEDVLPGYSCDIHLEGVFMRKMEIEETTKRAEYRDWRMVYIELRGTALNIYSVKKERGWWPSSSRHDGPDISPDSPPWVKKGSLERKYSLLHADAGIAADYRKRRYVIRMRVETDQFLLSCVELGTFVRWLDGIFAAIHVSPPIDERDFPRDFSDTIDFHRLTEARRRDGSDDDEDDGAGGEGEDEGGEPPDGGGGYGGDEYDGGAGYGPRTDHPIVGRLSTTSYPNENIDPDTGKWRPPRHWTTTHDQLYARLCYSVLLFKSPRKSNYIVARGIRWYVDWPTGRMIRVLPPAYGEVDVMGPWQVIHTENRRI